MMVVWCRLVREDKWVRVSSPLGNELISEADIATTGRLANSRGCDECDDGGD